MPNYKSALVFPQITNCPHIFTVQCFLSIFYSVLPLNPFSYVCTGLLTSEFSDKIVDNFVKNCSKTDLCFIQELRRHSSNEFLLEVLRHVINVKEIKRTYV